MYVDGYPPSPRPRAGPTIFSLAMIILFCAAGETISESNNNHWDILVSNNPHRWARGGGYFPKGVSKLWRPCWGYFLQTKCVVNMGFSFLLIGCPLYVPATIKEIKTEIANIPKDNNEVKVHHVHALSLDFFLL